MISPVRVDLHNHTRFSSDGRLAPGELLELAAEAGIACVAVTDHDVIDGALECLSLAERSADLPRVIPGIEISTRSGEIIALYVTERVPSGLSVEETAIAVRERGGLVYLPHPFDRLRRAAITSEAREEAAALADIVEVRNGRTLRRSFDDAALALAARLGKTMGAGSDAHYAAEVGLCYMNVSEVPERDTLLDLLRRGRPVTGPEVRDRLRAWRFHLQTGGLKARRRLGL